MSKSLPATPNLEHLRKQAKDLLAAFRDDDPTAVNLFQQHLPRSVSSVSLKVTSGFRLSDAQLVLAREYGFASWPKLKSHIEAVSAQTASLPFLLEATRKGDIKSIKKSIGDGADINGLVDGLFRVVAHPGAGDRVAVVRCLLQNGADPHLPAYDQASALDCWSYEGDASVVQVLLEHQADPNLGCAPSGETPLHYVTSRGHLPGRTECVKLLLAAGADPNRAAKVGVETTAYMRDIRVRGETPLHRAAIHGDEHMIQLLLDYGADPSLKDAHGESPLCWASWARRPNTILRQLLYGKFID